MTARIVRYFVRFAVMVLILYAIAALIVGTITLHTYLKFDPQLTLERLRSFDTIRIVSAAAWEWAAEQPETKNVIIGIPAFLFCIALVSLPEYVREQRQELNRIREEAEAAARRAEEKRDLQARIEANRLRQAREAAERAAAQAEAERRAKQEQADAWHAHQAQLRANRIAMIENHLLHHWTDYLLRHDFTGRGNRDELRRAFLATVTLAGEDADLIRYTQNPNVRQLLGYDRALPSPARS